jgi:DNA-directed RNA polymerase specialized sigma24 family protein
MAGHRINRPARPLVQGSLSKETRRRVVRETLSAMTEMQRLALSLYHYEKLGPAGIAEALEVPKRDVDRLLADGSAKVTRALHREAKRFDSTGPRLAA